MPDEDLQAGPPRARRWLLAPASFFHDNEIRHDLAIEIDEGRIEGFHPCDRMPPGLPIWQTELMASSGFLDVQVNGGGGVLFNASPDVDGIRAIVEAHRQGGTFACFPTVITDTDEVLDRAASAAIDGRHIEGFAGIHIEGPHLSPARRGTHRADLIRPWDEKSLARVERLRRAGLPVLLTLAPEQVPAGVIARLTALGAVVSLGHSAASPEVVRRAIAEGARAATHLYNGMDPPGSRTPGLVGTVILSELYASFIADGHHVHPDMLKIAHRARPLPGRMVLVSDAMPTVNGPPAFTLLGERIELREGRLVNAEGSLAGVHATMASSLAFLRANQVMSVRDALECATTAPARMMGLDRLLALRPGDMARLVLLDPHSLELKWLIDGLATKPCQA